MLFKSVRNAFYKKAASAAFACNEQPFSQKEKGRRSSPEFTDW
ncbi:TPA: hypothetical protein ACM4E9_004058 [Escherichia coli]